MAGGAGLSVFVMNDAVAIGVGALGGALSRYQCGRMAADWVATDPARLGRFQGWHTALINIGGSFILGGVTGAPTLGRCPKVGGAIPLHTGTGMQSSAFGMTPRTKLMMGVGFCGSFTTFSTYSVDIANWLAQGKTTKVFSYIAVNNVGGIVAAAAGMILVKKMFG
jgi:fluoride ion exporter CrcB/FEX